MPAERGRAGASTPKSAVTPGPTVRVRRPASRAPEACQSPTRTLTSSVPGTSLTQIARGDMAAVNDLVAMGIRQGLGDLADDRQLGGQRNASRLVAHPQIEPLPGLVVVIHQADAEL